MKKKIDSPTPNPQNSYQQRNLLPKKIAVFLALLMFAVQFAQASTKTASVTGNWSAGGTWTGGVAPVAGDVVIINDGVTVTIDASTAAVAGVTVGQGTSGVLQFPNSGTAVTLNISAGSLTVNAGATLQSYPVPTVNGTHAISLTNGSIVNNGTINLKNTASTFISVANTTILGTATGLTYSGTGTNTFNNFTQSNTSATPGFTLAANMNLAGVLNITAGFFGLNSNTISIAGTGTAITNTGTFNTNTGTVSLTGAAVQTLSSGVITIYNLSVNSTSTVTLGAATTVTNLSVNTGTLATSTLGLTATTTSVSGILAVNGATVAKSLGAVIINSGGAINSTVAATINSTGITISSGGTWSTATGAATINITGDLSNSGTFTNSIGSAYNISGNFINNGSVTSSTGTYTFSGTGVSFSGGTAFTITNLTISSTGNYTNSNTGGLTVGTLSIAAGGVLTLANNLVINTTFTQSGSLNCSTYAVTGAGTFGLTSAATSFLSLGDPNGITSTAATGNIQVTGTRTYGALANYIYNGNMAQVTGNQLPASIGTLTINNGAGVSLTASTTLTNTTATSLTLTNGALSIGAFTLTLNGGITTTSGSLTGGATSNLIITGATATATTIPAISGGLLNLTLSKSVATTFTLANGSSLSLAGTLSLSASNTLTDGGGTNSVSLSIAGATPIANSGTITLTGSGGSSLTINGTGAQTLTPGTATILNLNINSGNTVTQGGAVTATNLNVNTGTLATSGLALTVSGTTTVNSTLSINNTGAKALGTVIINSGGAINSTAAATITAASLTINSGGTWSTATGIAGVTISGDVSNSGTFTNSVASTYSIAGNFTNNGGVTSSTGLYTFTGNGKSFLGGTAFTITNLTISAAGNYTNSNTGGLTVGTLTITAGGGTLTLNNNLVINTAFAENGTLNCGAYAVTGAGTFTLANATNAYLSLGDPNGITSTAGTGNIQLTSTRTYGATANYTYNGAVPQVTGNQLPASIGTLTINNGSGVSLTASTSISGTAVTSLTLTNGALSIGAFTITLNGGITTTSGSLTGGSTSNLTLTGATAVTCNIPTIASGLLNLSLTKSAASTFTLTAPVALVGNLIINASNTLNDGGNTITVNGNATVAGAETGSGEVLLTGGTAIHSISGTGFNNLELSDASYNASMIAATTIGGALTLTTGNLVINALTLTLNGTVSGSGTLTGSTTSLLALAGTAGGNLGTLNFTAGAGQNLSTFTVNRGGTSPSVTLGNNLTVTGLSLTSGVVNLGSNTLVYNNSVTAPATGNSSCYFGILGSSGTSGGFQWNMTGVAAGTYKLPIGPSGVVSGYRPIQLVTSAATTATLLFNFINHDGTGTQSATNVPATGNNRAGYIANLDVLSGTLGQLTSLTMEYQSTDFNAGAPTVSNVAIYKQNGTSWVKVGQTSNGTDGSNTTVVQSTVNISGNTPLVLGVEGGNDLPGTSSYTWNGSVSTAWNNPNNWTPNTSYPQTSTDNVTIVTATNQPTLSTAISINNLTITSGTLTLAGFNLSVYGNISNSGTINSTAVGSTISMVGTSAQTISGGTWTTNLTGTNLLNLIINNNSGVSLNSNLAIQTGLTLTAGALGGSGTLTIGDGAAAVLVTRTAGSLSLTPSFYTFIPGVVYNLIYNGATGITTGNELPSTTTLPNGTYGTLTVNTAGTNVTMQSGVNANIGELITSVATTTTFNLNGNTLGLSSTTPIANTGVITANGAGSTIDLNGTAAQTLNPGTYTGTLISNLTIDNSYATSNTGAAPAVAITVGNLTVNSGKYFSLGAVNLNVTGNIINNGSIASSTAGGTITMNGSSAQSIGTTGTAAWTTSTSSVNNSLLNLVINNSSGVGLNSNLAIQSTITLTNGALGGTGTLTIGNGAAVTLSRTINGILTNVPSFYTFTASFPYTITYTGATTFSTGNELPSTTTLPNGTYGPLNVTTSGLVLTQGTATANIGSLNIASGATFNMGTSTLGLSSATAISNSGTLTANGGGTIDLNGSAAQTLNPGTYTGTLISNLTIDNSYATSNTGAAPAVAITVGNLTVNSGKYFSLGAVNLNVTGNIINNGSIASSTAGGTITMNGSSAQSIGTTGTAAWTTSTSSVNNSLLNLVINNSSGVGLNSNLAIQSTITLTNGALGGTGTLTIGNGAAVTLSRTINGTLTNAPSFYTFTASFPYTITYTGATTFSTGNELPSTTTLPNGTYGPLNVNTSGMVLTQGTATANIGSLNIASGATYNLNGNTLGLATATAITNSGTLNPSTSGSSIILNGTAAQTLTLGTFTGSALTNLTLNNSAGATLNTNTTINNALTLTAGQLTVSAVTLTLKGTVSGGGSLTGAGASVLTLNASSGGSMGTINMPSAGGAIGTFNMNNTGSTPSVTINGNLAVSTAFTLTSGIVYMGNGLLTYSGTAASMPVTNCASGAGTSYFAFLGAGGFQWNMVSIAAGTYQWPVGPNGTIAGCRPVQLTTAASVTSNIKVGFINEDGSGTVSATNVLNDASDTRANFIANITASVAVSANITLSYINGDFNNSYAGSPAPTVFNFAGTGWTTNTTGSVGSANGVSTIKTSSAFALPIGTTAVIPATTITTTGSGTATWTAGAGTNVWATAGNWSPAAIPTTTTNVVISNSSLSALLQPSISTAATGVTSISIASGCTLNMASGGSITVSGSVNNSGTINQAAGTFTFTGPFTNSGTTSITGTLSLGGSITNTGTITPNSGSTFTYTGTSQTIQPLNYYTLTTSSATTPILSPTGTIGINTAFNPGTTNYSAGNTTGSTIQYNVAATLTYNGFPFYNLIINTGAFTLGATSPATIANNLTINSGATLADATNLITGPGPSTGTFTINGTGIYTTTNTNAYPIPVFGTYAFASTSTVNMNAAASQNIAANSTPVIPTFGNLSLSAGAGYTKTALGATTIAGNLSIATSNTLADGGNTISVYGNITNVGTHSGSGKISITGGSANHTISAAAASVFGNLDINDNVYQTVMSNTGTSTSTTVSGILSVSSGYLYLNGFATSLIVTGGTNVTGNLNFASATGTRSMGNLTINSGGTVKDSIAPSTLTIANLTNNGTWNNAINGAVAITGTITNNGTFTSGTGIYTLSGAAQSITTTNSSPLTISSAIISGTYSVNATFTSSNVLSIPTLNLSVAASTLTNNGVMTSAAVTDAGTTANAFTNNGTLSIATGLTGAGAFTNAAGANLFFAGASIGLGGTWTSTASGNTVTYNGTGAQAVKASPYYNLSIGTTSPTAAPTATAAAAFTVSNNFAVNAGTFLDGGFVITGNGTGAFSVGPGATYTTTKATSTYMPTLYTSVTLDPASTFNYNGGGGTIPSNPNGTATTTAYGLLGIGGSGTKTLATAISATGLNIAASCTLVDGGFQISGPGTGSGTFTMGSASVFTSTNTNNSTSAGYFGPTPLFQTYNFNAASTVNYNAAVTQNIYNVPAPGYGNLTSSAASASTKSLVATTYVQGTVTTAASNTLNLNGDTIYIAGATPITDNGVITANATGSSIILNGTASQTFTIGTYTGSLISNLIDANTNASGILLGGNYNVNNVTINTSSLLNLNAKTLTIGGQYTNNGTITANAASSTIALNGTSAQTFAIGTYTGNALYDFTVINSAGVTLGSALNVSGVLNLSSGIVSTTSTNLLTVTNTAAGGIIGGGSAAYVSGPLARNFTTSSTGANLFPVGASIYNLFQLTNPVVSSGTVTVTAQVYDVNAGGSPGAGMSALNTNRYWQVAVTGTGTLSSVGSVALNETTPTLVNGTNAISQASTVNGSYKYKGGTVSGSTITSTSAITPSLGYFVIGTKGTNLCPGPYAIGPTGDFLTLSDVATLLNGVTMSCNLLFELQPTYASASEAFPIAFTNITNTGNYTLTFRPQSGVSSMLITSGPATAAPVVNLNGVTYVTFDGRPGSSGTSSYWTIQNTTASSSYPAIQFINGASKDTLEFMTVLSSGTNTTANVLISTSTLSGGNSNNTIQNCNIGPYSTSSYNLISSTGSTTSGYLNSNNSILNNNLYNFQGYFSGPAPVNGGIYIGSTGNGNNWVIKGNSFYGTYTTSGYYLTCINFAPGSSSTGDSIYGNYIGGQSAQCGGSAWNSYGYDGYGNFADFTGIYVNASGPVVAYNTIQNIKLGYTSGSQFFAGITANIASGLTANISYNTIGSTSTANSVRSGQYGEVVGIYNEGVGTIKIDHNTIANLTSDGSNGGSSGFSYSGVCGIYILGNSTNTITNNVVANLSAGTNSNGNSYAQTTPGGGGSNTTAGGTVTETLAAANMMVTGIYLPSAVNSVIQTISENTIYGLTTTITGSGARNGITGIISNAYGTGTTININGNTIYGLYGPNNYGSTPGTYYLALTGLYIGPSQQVTYNVTNNMIDLGYKTSDGSTVTNSSIRGIWDNSNYNNVLLKMNFFHNSVYIGGSDNTALNSYAFSRDLNYSSTVYDSIRLENNIFYNNRSSSGTGKQYGIYLDDYNGSVDAASDYNVIYGTGTNFISGNTGNGSTNVDYSTLASWTSASGFDAHSTASDPVYILPVASSSPYTPNLRINSSTPTPVEGLGNAAYTITYDIDSDVRASYSPVDIGAYAGNFLSLLKITSLPSSTTVCTGSAFTLSTTVVGEGPTTYQWYYENTAITGAGGTIAGNDSTISYSLPNTQIIDTGSYSVIVSHTGGSDTSNTSVLHVTQSPVISAQPTTTQTIALGSSFTVSVTASPATSYQWTKNGANISGATNSSYTISSVVSTDAASSPGYACVITSSGCAVTSNAGILIVAAPSVVFNNYNTASNNQIAFNNAYINTTTPFFSLTGSYALGNITAYRIDISTDNTFGTTNWTQTFTGTFASGSQNDFQFTNASSLSNGTTYYVRALASVNGGTTYGSASSGTWSFTYKSAATSAEWRQQMTPQFATWTANSNVTASSNLITITTAPTNQVTDPCMATGTNWNEYVNNDAIGDWAYNYGETTYGDGGTNYSDYITGSCSSTGILVARNWNSNYVSGNSYSVFVQQLNLTNVSTISLDMQIRTANTSPSTAWALGAIDFAVELGGNDGSTGGLMSGTSVTDGGTEVENIQSPATPHTTTGTTQGTLTFNVPSALQTTGVYLKLIEYNPSSSNFTGLYYSGTYGGSFVSVDVDNILAMTNSVGTFTTTPVYLASFKGASGWNTLTWGQTLNGGADTFKIQQSSDGVTWTDATGLTNITTTGTSGSQNISSLGNVAAIRIVGRMAYGTSSPSINYMDIGTKTGPTITYSPLPNTTSLSNPSAVSTTITTSPGSINVTSGTAPRIYYKKVSDSNNSYVTTGSANTSSNTGWKWVEQTSGSPFSLQIDYSKLYGGTVSVGDLIEYFVVAQDGTPTVAINSGSFNAIPTSVTDYADIFPVTGAINKYWILPTSGTYYVGTTAGANFPSITGQYGVFNALDSTTLTGNITFKVTSSLNEDGTYALNQWKESGAGGYTAQVIPTDTTASGTIYQIFRSSGTNDLIRFDNAGSNTSATSRFTMDGQNTGDGIKHFRIRNTNTANATFSFINDAQNIRISNSYIESANANTYTSGATTNSVGTIFFGNAKSGGVGNQNDTISYSSINDAGGSIPANGIWSYNATSSTTNHNIAILNNNIYNFFQNGIYATPTGNGPNWKIANNIFYSPSNLASYETSVPQQIAIYLASGSGSYSDTITGNTIGGSAADNSGTWTNSASALDYEGIRLDIGGSSGQTTLVSNNVIKNINLTGTGFSYFMGVRVKNGLVDIIGNRVGDLTGNTTTSIQVAGNGSDGAGDDNMSEIYGIWNYSTSASNINYDTVAGITASGAYSYLTGIRRGAIEFGTNSLNQMAGQTNMGNNVIANLASGSALSGVFLSGPNVDQIWPAALTGIASASNYQSGTTVNTYHNNLIYNLSAYGTWNRWVRVFGMALNGDPNNPVNNGKVYSNKINNLTDYNGGVSGYDIYTPEITGIELGYLYSTASFTVFNNMIELQPVYYTGNSYNDAEVFGILNDADNAHSNVNKFYYNTILIGGTDLPGGSNNSYAYLRYGSGTGSTQGGTDTLENNIFINQRTGGNGSVIGGGNAEHFAIGNGTTSPSNGWHQSNYNFLVSANTSTVGEWNGTAETFSNWQSVQPSGSGQDNNSYYAQTTTGNTVYSTNPGTAEVNTSAGHLFVDPTDVVTSSKFLHISFTDNSYEFVKGVGMSLANAYSDITLDIDSTSRSNGTSPSGPTLGAHESPSSGGALPVQLIYLEAYPVNNQFIQLAWATAVEINNRQFNIERSIDGINWEQIDSVPGHGNITAETDYKYNDMHVLADVRYYYRLKQIDFNGNYSYTDIVTAILTGETAFTVTIAPNPAAGNTNLFVVSPVNQQIDVEIYDVLGQRIYADNYQVDEGANTISVNLSRFAAGTYSVVLTAVDSKVTQKLVITH